MINAANTIQIGRLRVKSSGCDHLTAKSRLAHVFNTADVYPTNLPPAAILCIRQMRDPLPATLQFAQPLVRPPRAWENAVHHQLEAFARHAVRPWHEAVPPHANAVLFSDQAELLACLARDWLAGVVGQSWWWALLVPAQRFGSSIAYWQHQPAYVPAACTLLAQHAQLAPFVARWQPHQIVQMVSDLLRQFAITQPAELFVVNNDYAHSSPSHVAHHAAALAVLPDQPHVAMLTHEQQVLVGVATLLHLAPDLMRTSYWQTTINIWQHTVNQPLSIAQSTGFRQSEQVMVADSQQATPANTPIQRDRQQQVADHVRSANQPSVYPVITPAAECVTSDSSGWFSHDDVPTDSPKRKPIDVMTQQVITTQLGGVMYLLNVGQRMGLYGDFTTPLTTGIRLNIWDFVARTARRLLVQRQPTDPIWEMLATLRGTPLLDQHHSSRMVTLLLPFVRRRLLTVLQLDDQSQIGATLCHHRARIFCTATHLDVVLALNDLPLVIRMAGLDRDPGWIPAAGRFVRFHFE